MIRLRALALVLVLLGGIAGVSAISSPVLPGGSFSPGGFTTGHVSIGLTSPFNYAAIPAGTEIGLSISGTTGFSRIQYARNGDPAQLLGPPYTVDTSTWPSGMNVLRLQAIEAGATVASETFVFFINPNATWPPDTIPVDLVLVGFPVAPPGLLNRLISSYNVVRTRGQISESFDLRFDFEIHLANASYQADLLAYLQTKAVYRDDLQARLNLTALIDQRDNGTRRDIFDPLEGWEIDTSWAELYLEAFPPIPDAEPRGYTFYFLNLSALDDPGQGVDHWFVEETVDPDTQQSQNWWRLEWDNDLNTPMGYPLNTWGGPEHVVYIDPTAYQWYLDWTHVWWAGGMERAPYGFQWEEIAPTSDSRLDYLAGSVNDLIQGLGVALPAIPPAEPAALIQNFVLSGSGNYSLDGLRWTSSDVALQTYYEMVFPFKSWTVATTFGRIEDDPELEAVVDGNTTFSGGQGAIDAVAVFNHLLANKEQYVPDQPDVFEVLSVNFLYDNRSMVFGGREFTGLGGSGITAIFLKTDRLFDGNGTRQKGLTSIISHETGHNLGYGHQFGPNFRADFVEGNMGYFRNDLSYGLFWEDAIHRLYLRAKHREVLGLIEDREPLDLGPEFTAFYAAYRDFAFLDAYALLDRIEQMVIDRVPPVADAGPDWIVAEDVPTSLDGGASSDNFRILAYTWDFDDGTLQTGPAPTVTKTWSEPGTYDVTLLVSDAGGNLDTDTLTVTVLDVTPPTVRILSPEPGVTLPTVVTVAWEVVDNGPSIARLEVRLDGSAPILLGGEATEFTFTALEHGPHVVAVTAYDAADNRDEDSVSFQVDAGLPTPEELANFWTLVGVGVAVAILATLLFLLLYWRPRRRRPKNEPPP